MGSGSGKEGFTIGFGRAPLNSFFNKPSDKGAERLFFKIWQIGNVHDLLAKATTKINSYSHSCWLIINSSGLLHIVQYVITLKPVTEVSAQQSYRGSSVYL